jgi:hypothetical protein
VLRQPQSQLVERGHGKAPRPLKPRECGIRTLVQHLVKFSRVRVWESANSASVARSWGGPGTEWPHFDRDWPSTQGSHTVPPAAQLFRWRCKSIKGEDRWRAGVTALDESGPLEAVPPSPSLAVLNSCPFIRFVAAYDATCRRSKDAVMSGEMTGGAAHYSTL